MKHFRIPYTPDAPLVARVPFRFNGVSFKPGDAFPGDKVGHESVPERRRRQMYDSRHVEVGEHSSAAKQQEQPPRHPNGDGARLFVAKHSGFGRFQVIGADGVVVEDGLSKQDARAKAKALNEPAGEREGPAVGSGGSAPSLPVAGPPAPAGA